jgi:hypothetical protein
MDDKFKKLEVLFLSLLGFQIVVSLTAIFLASNSIVQTLPDLLIYIKIFIMLQIFVTVVYGNYYFKTKMKLVRQETDTDKKQQIYFMAYSVRLFLLAISNILNVMAFVISSNEIYIIVTIPLLFLYFIYKPDKKLYAEKSTADTL